MDNGTDPTPPKHGRDTEFGVSVTTLSSDNSETLNSTLKLAHRKVDIRLLAWYTLVLAILKVDAHNITNAAIMNVEIGDDIKHQLDLGPGHWAWIIGAFYYPYLVFDPISTLLLKRCTPRKWMGRIMLTWGIISMCQAAATNFALLLVCRFLLGLAEAGFLPGMLYHLSFWYPAQRLTLRIALLFAASMLAGSVSGIVAFGISFLNRNCGLAGWQWLFILEGIPAVLCSVYTFFFLPNYPSDASFLSEEEKTSVQSDLPDT